MTADDRALEHSNPDEYETFRQIGHLAHQLRDIVATAQRIAILTHANPDADAVSSALGVAELCRRVGAEPALVATGDSMLPPNLTFIPGAERVRESNPVAIAEADLLVLVDCSDEQRLGPIVDELAEEFERRRPIINIDHHVTNTRFGSFNIVVPEAAATAEIITTIFDALALEIDAQTATTLLAGVYGDTLGLRTPSTTPATLRTAAMLLERGAELDEMVDQLFRLKPYSTVCLWAEALQRTQWHGSLIWSQVDTEMLERANADRSEAEGLVNFLAGTIGARASALLYHEPWGWRVSMRTLADDVNVAEILTRFDGGGHPRAAGARLASGEAARDEFLATVAALLDQSSSTGDLERADGRAE